MQSFIYGIATCVVHERVNMPNRCFFVGFKVWVTAVSENELIVDDAVQKLAVEIPC